jgi:hypothetical protein
MEKATICRNCKYWRDIDYGSFFNPERFTLEDISNMKKLNKGNCTRYPPYRGWSIVSGNDLCGDFEAIDRPK